MYDTEGQFCGPKYWDSLPWVDSDSGIYYISSYKRDETMYETEVYLQPAGAPPVVGSSGPIRPVIA